jgi:hypothetical protein
LVRSSVAFILLLYSRSQALLGNAIMSQVKLGNQLRSQVQLGNEGKN